MLLTAQVDAEVEDPTPLDLYRFGTVAMVMRSMRLPDGRVKVLVQGLARVRVEEFEERDTRDGPPVTPLPATTSPAWSVEIEAVMRAVRSRVEELLALKNLPPEVLAVTSNVQEPGRLADLVASNLKLRLEDAQEILEIADPLARLRRVDALLRRSSKSPRCRRRSSRRRRRRSRAGIASSSCASSCARSRASSAKSIRASRRSTSTARRSAIGDARRRPSPRRCASSSASSACIPDGPEAQVVRGYLEWMTELPWSQTSPERLDLANARAILDVDHAHLEAIKDRILEALGVRKLRPDSKGPILC